MAHAVLFCADASSDMLESGMKVAWHEGDMALPHDSGMALPSFVMTHPILFLFLVGVRSDMLACNHNYTYLLGVANVCASPMQLCISNW